MACASSTASMDVTSLNFYSYFVFLSIFKITFKKILSIYGPIKSFSIKIDINTIRKRSPFNRRHTHCKMSKMINRKATNAYDFLQQSTKQFTESNFMSYVSFVYVQWAHVQIRVWRRVISNCAVTQYCHKKGRGRFIFDAGANPIFSRIPMRKVNW